MSHDIAGGAADLVQGAIDKLHEAQKLVASLQEACKVGGHLPKPGDQEAFNLYQLWHKLETIDDRLHEAGSYLGA